MDARKHFKGLQRKHFKELSRCQKFLLKVLLNFRGTSEAAVRKELESRGAVWVGGVGVQEGRTFTVPSIVSEPPSLNKYTLFSLRAHIGGGAARRMMHTARKC